MRKSLTRGLLPAISAAMLTASTCAGVALAEGSFDLSTIPCPQNFANAENISGTIGNGFSSIGNMAARTTLASGTSYTSDAARHAICEATKIMHMPGQVQVTSNRGQIYMAAGCGAGPNNLITLP